MKTFGRISLCFLSLLIVGALLVSGDIGPTLTPAARLSSTVSQAKAYGAAVTTFRDAYGNALPGDIADASALPDCESGICNPHPKTAGDNIIGSPDFFRTLKPQITQATAPATSAADETTLFWTHLLKADLLSGVTDAGVKSGTPLAWGVTHPAAKIGGGFIVGYADGLPLPKSLSPANEGMKGTVVVTVSAPDGSIEPNAKGQQPMSPLKAAQIDRKFDDGKPHSGQVQAYGSPYCFTPHPDKTTWIQEPKTFIDSINPWYAPKRIWSEEEFKSGDKYAEMNTTNECGLIFLIAPDVENKAEAQ